jgi:hypothetical protein
MRDFNGSRCQVPPGGAARLKTVSNLTHCAKIPAVAAVTRCVLRDDQPLKAHRLRLPHISD